MVSFWRNIAFRFYLKHFFSPEFTAEKSLRDQQQILNQLCRELSPTQLGAKLGLGHISTYEEFRNKIPVTQYDFYEPYIARIMAGEKSVMSSGVVKWLAKTAGTTSGKSKLIPITSRIIHRNHVRGVFFSLSKIHQIHQDFHLLNHKTLLLPGGIYETLPVSGITIGDISAIMALNVPFLYRSFYVPDLKTQTRPDWEGKLEQTVRQIIHEDVGTLSGVPTWHLATLQKMMHHVSFHKLTDVWKNLRLFIHGGVSFEPYRQQFEEIAGRTDFIFYEVYNATEGFFGIQKNSTGGDLLLLTENDIFYEFIPLRKYTTGNLEAIPLSEVEINIPYALLITASNGLVRYVVGDVLTFTNLHPFSFRITGRTQEYINAFGEDLLLANVENALMKACQISSCSVKEYTVAPFYINMQSKGRIQFLIEFSKAPENLKDFELNLDEQLKRENSNYAQKRSNNLALAPLELLSAPEGTFYRWMFAQNKLGGQNKVPRLVNGRRVMEELLQVIEQNIS
ncbi:MAG: GH3 auxin-responsive promoter family protein [Bacteroidetes bacterium]|nr:GH3 auxin-responsive promoter family protein [Bacteroidota bacterium]